MVIIWHTGLHQETEIAYRVRGRYPGVPAEPFCSPNSWHDQGHPREAKCLTSLDTLTGRAEFRKYWYVDN